MSPVGFFVAGKEDKEKKIADLRGRHDSRTNVRGFKIPRVDWEGYQNDPIGASLDTFQSVLQGVIDRDTQQRREQRAEGQAVASDLYKAYEAAGVEKNEQQLADEFYEQTGLSIYSVTRQHGRFVGQATGRIAGRNAASEMSKRIDAMEFKTPDEFDTAYEAEIAKYDKEAFNDSEKQGYLEILGKGRNAMTEKVFAGSLLLKEKQARQVYGAELQGTFAAAVVAEDEVEGWSTYRATILAGDAEMRASNPSLTDEEIESVYVNTITAELNDGKHLDRVDDAVDGILASGVVKTQKGRSQLLAKKREALRLHEMASTDPSPEVKDRLANRTPAMVAEFLKNGEWSEKAVNGYLEAGGKSNYAVGQLATLERSLSGIRSGTKNMKGTITAEDKLAWYIAKRDNDLPAMRAVLSTEFLSDAMGNDTSEAFVKTALSDFRASEKGKLTPARDALSAYMKWAENSPEDLTPKALVQQYEDLQNLLTNLPGGDVTAATKIKDRFIANIENEYKAKNELKTEVQRITDDGALLSSEAATMVADVDTRIEPAALRAETLRVTVTERQKILLEKPGFSFFGEEPGRSIDKLKKSRKALKKLENELIDLRVERKFWKTEQDELYRIEKATQGMTKEETLSYHIWNGHADGSDRQPYYS